MELQTFLRQKQQQVTAVHIAIYMSSADPQNSDEVPSFLQQAKPVKASAYW